MGLTRLAIVRPLVVLVGLLFLVLLGAVSYTKLSVDQLPPLTIGSVFVSVSWPQASAEDVEQLVAEPIEDAIAGMEGVSEIDSTSTEGRARVGIDLVEGADPTAAAIEVSRRLAAIRNRLPSDAGEPTVNKADPNAAPILNVALTGAPLDQLFDVANDQLLPQLQSVPGVGAVNLSGGLQREIQVKVDTTRMAAYGLSVQQVTNALAAANVTAPVGTVPKGPQQQLDIRAIGRFETPDALAKLVVAQTAAGPVLLRDVATVQAGYKDQTQLQRLNGQDAVGLSVVKQTGANTIEVADAVHKTLDDLRGSLPPGTVLRVTNDTSIYTRGSLDAIQRDLLLAVFLVGVVMLVFLHEWRNTAIVLLAIPTSLIGTFLVMYLLGFTLNVMTLMALALMIGILVDDSIVVLENIQRHLELGEGPWEAALKGRSEIGLAAIAITLADVVVYIPIAFMGGTVGQLFRQYGLTVVTATLLSLLVSFTLTPMLASRWLSRKVSSVGPLARFGRWWDEWFGRLAGAVAGTVPATVRRRWLVVLVSFTMVVAVAAMIPLGLIGTEYSPTEDNNNFNGNLQTPPGTTLQGTDAAARQMEALLLQITEVQAVFTTVTGPGAGFGGGGGGSANFAVQLVDKGQRRRSAFDVVGQARALARQVPGATFSAQVANPLGRGGGGGISIDLTGPDLATLSSLADQIQATAAGVPGVADVRNTGTAGSPDVEIALDGDRMAQLGVTTQSVANALRTTLGGTVASELRPTGQAQQDITVIAGDVTRSDLANLASLPVGGGTGTGSAGGVVTLGQIATIRPGTGPVQIQRIDRTRSLSLNANVANRPLAAVAADLRTALTAVPLPPGYTVTLRGQVQQLNNALTQLGTALVLSLVLEYLLLVALYESWLLPLVRMLTVPLGLAGAVLGLYLTQNTINIYSIIGMIMAEGLVAKSGILLVDYTQTLRERGMERTEALAQAARTRLRPILMTSATMICGMIPLALKLEPGAESRAPMAVVVIGGMLFSTVLTLVVVPALYTLFDDLQARFRRGAQPRAAREAASVPAREPRVEGPALPPRTAPVPVVADGYPDGYPASRAGVEAGG